jgi:gamma-glutamyl hercynylcysteine S-oxide synthase
MSPPSATPALLGELSTIQELCAALVEGIDDAACRTQYHPELSPLGWHLGHCAYIEAYWVREVVSGDALAAALHELYNPERMPKPLRGPALPERARLLAWTASLHSEHLMRLADPNGDAVRHPLMEGGYLPRFLLQHHSQHYETMLMVLAQRALAQADAGYRVRRPLVAAPPRREAHELPAGHYRIGGERVDAYDNELPPQHAELGACRIALRPVSNAEYLGFMQSGGYAEPRHWSEAAWAWRTATGIEHPGFWRRDTDGHWYTVGLNGAYDLVADAPVQGISHHEASAFAAWAGARLPHEYQWEAARRLGLLEESGRVWEWCANTFHPYAGFKPFPYEGYSTPWFDGNHYVLRGGSIHTRPVIARPSFRNFYQPDKRHLFAGLRLAF